MNTGDKPKNYTYIMKSESGEIFTGSDNMLLSDIEFMEKYASDEYNAWKMDDVPDDDIYYDDFIIIDNRTGKQV